MPVKSAMLIAGGGASALQPRAAGFWDSPTAGAVARHSTMWEMEEQTR